MKDKILIKCPIHPEKKFFKCSRCEDIEVYCEHCHAAYRVTVVVDDDGIRSEFKLVTKSA